MLARKRLTAVVITALSATCAVGASNAFADAPPNPNNCEGSFVSSLTPDFTSHGAFGAFVRPQAQAGYRGDVARGFADTFANCGQNP